MMTKYEELLHWALEYSKKQGCQECRVRVNSGISNQIEMRNGEIEVLQQSRDQKLVISFFIDDRYGSVSSNRLDISELSTLIDTGIQSIRLLEPDSFRKLPAPSLYYSGKEDLKVADPNFDLYEPECKIGIAQSINDSTWGHDERLISLNSAYSDAYCQTFIADSQGLNVSFQNTFFSASAQCTVRTSGDYRPEASDYAVAIDQPHLDYHSLGATALERALSRIGQTKLKSGSYTALVDHRAINTLLSPIVNALYGSSIYQKESFLASKLGELCFSPLFQLEDRPLQTGVLGASLFDREGIATSNRVIFHQGTLHNFFIDTYFGGKLGMDTTIEGPSILMFPLGVKNTSELILTIDDGIYITGFNGGNCNGVTGDFSYGIEGFRIERGLILFPVSEMNISGNMFDLWNSMTALSCDTNRFSSWKTPSIVFDSVEFSGE